MSRNMKAILLAAVVVTVVVGAYVLRSEPATPESMGGSMDSAEDTGSMGDAMAPMKAEISSAEYVPAVKAYYEGGKLYFIHTEASDTGVADMLTMMMGPDVILMPELADIPNEFLADIYVFTNGLKGDGPFGFQPDIFDAVPGDEGYSPLRAVNLVEWREDAEPRELRAMDELEAAEDAGDITIEQPGIVVNVPVITWPGGQR